MFKWNHKKISKLVNLPLLVVVRAYQLVVSPWLAPRCKFYPSCSEYAVEALKELPSHRAIRLIIWRLLRCQPFHSGGVDPVPKR